MTEDLSAHHALSAHEVVLLLDTDPRSGLRDAEAEIRLARYGPNVLPAATAHGPFRRFLEQFQHPLVYVLLGAGLIAGLLGQAVDAVVIFGVVIVNAIVGFAQETRAQTTLDSLRTMVRTLVRLVRGGSTRTLDARMVVPGDLVLVAAGDRVAADLRLVEETDLEVDESALTGESAPVVKDEVVLPAATVVADRRNMLYSGTLVTKGAGAGIVVATGTETELGEIHRLVGGAEGLETPLTRKLGEFSRVLTVGILLLAGLAFVVGIARGERASEMLTAAVALAVGAIPEGLPAAVTITLAIGMARLAHRRAVIRRLPAVETLGSTTVICTDKTGTLTANEMTVRSVWTTSGLLDLPGAAGGVKGAADGAPVPGLGAGSNGSVLGSPLSDDVRWCLTIGALCNDATVVEVDGAREASGDPTEVALLAAATRAGLSTSGLAADWPRQRSVPFSSERRLMATFHSTASSTSTLVLVKGATEEVLRLCASTMGPDGSTRPLDETIVTDAAARLAGRGLRVLGFAMGRCTDADACDTAVVRGQLTFVGMQAMQDPPRPEVFAAVRSCQEAGIVVKMITGDHAATARAIATQLHILEDEESDRERRGLVTGGELELLTGSEFDDSAEGASVFARVTAEQKLRLVRALQGRHHVVAMTGDGVNDAPALRQADIGIAMGDAGTEVAKDAADMVLSDDSFATIEAAVEEGRGIFDNLLKFIVWTLPTNLGEGAVILVAIVLGTALPILPSQILWINMTTAVLLGLTLAFEPKEPGIMTRSPRDPTRPLLTWDLVVRTLLVSALLVAGAWWLFEWEQAHGTQLAEARTTALNAFVMVEAFYLLSCRSLSGPSWRLNPVSNPWLLLGLAAQGVAQLVLTYVPVMQRLFGTAAISLGAWGRIVLVALVASAVVSIDKRVRRRSP
jgi:cation-transporting ATPase F